MTLEELNNRIREEYALFRHFAYLYDYGETEREKLEKNLENIFENIKI